MFKFWIFGFFYSVAISQAAIANDQKIHINTSLTYNTIKTLGIQNGLRSTNQKKITKFGIGYDLNNLSSQLRLNHDGNSQFNLDGSYIQYTKGIATFGFGTIDRHWSFSNNASLILSNNARPSKSIYMKLNNKFGLDWLPSEANWSLEFFNGYTEGSLSNTQSMLLGTRAILSPIAGLDLELIQTSQWGGKGYNSNMSALSSALFLDTNAGSNSNINKMAGFGISYLKPSNIIPLRFYGQMIGEDEAGLFPSCYTYLAGIEWPNTKIKYPTVVGVETVNTRVDSTEHGFCGPNTMYNNNTYDYTNYGKVMGAEIDTEGTSLGLYVRTQISQAINIEYSIKSVVINDNNWSNHRLSSKHETGLINSLSTSWNKNSIRFNGSIHYQNFSLDKADIKKGYGVSLYSSITF